VQHYKGWRGGERGLSSAAWRLVNRSWDQWAKACGALHRDTIAYSLLEPVQSA